MVTCALQGAKCGWYDCLVAGVAVACNCNVLGSLRQDCEQMTGRCVCRPGVTGQKCNLCPNGKRLSHTGCTGLSVCLSVCTHTLTL